MNDMENLRTFADQLWKYMVPKLDSKFASNVSYFRAQVVSNPGNNKLEVQRPVENGTLTLPCVRAMSNAQPGQQVVALVMGSMSNAIVVGDGNLNVPGGGGVDPNHTHITTQVLDLVNADSYGPSGMVSFDADVSEVPLKSCLVEIKPAQEGSGDPSPSNIRPISGWTGAKATRSGKNLAQLTANSTQLNGLTFTVDKAAGTVTVNGTSTAKTYFSVFARANAYPYLDDISYVLSGCPSGGSSATYYAYNGVLSDGFVDYGSGSPTKMGNQLTKGNGQNYYIYVNTGVNCNNLVFRPMIRVAGTDATFEPYKGQTIEYTFPTEAGTVYGGTLDVLSGLLTVDRALITLNGTESVNSFNNNTYGITLSGITMNPDGKISANQYPAAMTTTWNNMPDMTLWAFTYGRNSYVRVRNTGLASVDAFKASLENNHLQVAYPIAEPVTYQLTPQIVTALAGQNNFWADCGDVTVEYGAFLAAEAEARNIASDILDANKSDKDHTHQLTRLTGVLPISMGGTSSTDGRIHVGTPDWGTIGLYSTSEGYETNASGQSSHAEGQGTTASGGVGSHAEGFCTEAKGTHGSHAEGAYTIAAGRTQHVFGRYNISDTTSVEIVGWGTSSTRKNIRTLSTTGNEWIAGTLTQASDARLKDVQGEIPDLSSIRAVRFRWKNGDDKEHLGYLAQDVEGVAPYLVGVDSNGYKSLDYIALLTAKVEMLEREIEKLKGR